MTCIIGLIDNGTVWMGGDSAGVAGYDLHRCVAPKVFRNGQFLFGFTSSFRMGQLLQHVFKPPPPPSGRTLERFLASTFIDAVRKCLDKGGFAKKKDEVESAGQFLLGVRGHIVCVDSGYNVSERREGFDAVGCGSDLALGALFATAELPPRERIQTALEAAEHFCIGVSGPFTIVSLKPERSPK